VALAGGAVILKPHRGYHGVGITVVETPDALPAAELYPELVFAQRLLGKARKDLKVFGIGDELFGVRKAFAADSFLRAGEPVPLPPAVQEIARRAGQAFGLTLFGLDMAEDDTGVSVIDVNYFPGYRGVPEAARRLAEYLLKTARG
jgi:ribosomal protein S6--L-glutamate ligase